MEPAIGTLLQVADVTVRFGALVALDAVGFTIERGELAALIGPNGAGKSTLFDVINGVRRPTAGSVRIAGIDVTGRGPTRVARLGVSRTFQNVRLAGTLTVTDNVRLGLHGRTWAGRSDARRRVDDVLEYVGLVGVGNRFPAEISYGERKRVEVARAIVNRPELLLLDEPFAGLNGTESATMVDLVRRVHADGSTVLLVEHDMSVVMSLAERVVVLNFGRKLADGSRAVVRADPAVIEAYLGTHG
jgi:branched-chain amino acid transport system ATP-binding protein